MLEIPSLSCSKNQDHSIQDQQPAEEEAERFALCQVTLGGGFQEDVRPDELADHGVRRDRHTLQ